MHSSDTIAAIATPPGHGGIAVLRVSGPDALAVLQALFLPSGAPDAAFVFHPRHMHYGRASDEAGNTLDDVLAVFMPGPSSATGEDVGEIHCHGGMGVSEALLEAALSVGARLAAPGEFTRRAFLNGRMDLSQAEAVAELISAPTKEGVRLAAAKLEGRLSHEIGSLRASLDALRMQATLAVDFPDEDAELLPQETFARTVRTAKDSVRALLAAFERARLWREGAVAVLAGRVNAGKSNILNALLGRPRAIVSDEPGTTRDYLEESVNLRGLPLRMIDTAGLRDGGGLVEAEGIRRTKDLAAEADILLFVTDIRQPLCADEWDFLRSRTDMLAKKCLLTLLNKIDTLPEPGKAASEHLLRDAPPDLLPLLRDCPCFAVSARTGVGLDALADGMLTALRHTVPDQTAPHRTNEPTATDIAPNLRQSLLLRKTAQELEELEQALAQGLPPDILNIHLESASSLLEDVTGSSGNEEILDTIFSSFCIGK